MRVLEEIAPRTINALANQRQRAEAGAWLAHLLATCPDAGIRDATAAVTLARNAAKLNPQVARIWNTLGVTFYRTGEWDAAIEALEKSLESQPRADASGRLFLAMAYWQKGDREQARQWYDKAVSWMEKNPATNDDFVRSRDEAAAMLGMTGQPKPAERRRRTHRNDRLREGRAHRRALPVKTRAGAWFEGARSPATLKVNCFFKQRIQNGPGATSAPLPGIVLPQS